MSCWSDCHDRSRDDQSAWAAPCGRGGRPSTRSRGSSEPQVHRTPRSPVRLAPLICRSDAFGVNGLTGRNSDAINANAPSDSAKRAPHAPDLSSTPLSSEQTCICRLYLPRHFDSCSNGSIRPAAARRRIFRDCGWMAPSHGGTCDASPAASPRTGAGSIRPRQDDDHYWQLAPPIACEYERSSLLRPSDAIAVCSML